MKLIESDCIQAMREMEDNSVDSIVTDPPYELGFMGKSWDASGIAFNVGVWQEALRVLKPGGFLLAFSGSRTYHRMAVAIEDAGFEIRDQIMWVYGSGFPKSHDVSKAIDKAAGAEREVVGTKTAGIGTGESYGKIVGERKKAKTNLVEITAPATDEAKQWQGWGTALKPAHEPIVVARKPLIGTVAENVLAFGTGGLNIDGARVPGEPVPINKLEEWSGFGQKIEPNYKQEINTSGRWPANFIHDGSDEVLELFPSDVGGGHWTKTKTTGFGEFGGGSSEYFGPGEKDKKGSAARFFYCAKANRRDRNEGLEVANHHPTVKPTDLMRYLCRLVTPPSGIVLDPFMGSGSTGKAATMEGFDFIGIDMNPEYMEIAKARIEFAQKKNDEFLL